MIGGLQDRLFGSSSKGDAIVSKKAIENGGQNGVAQEDLPVLGGAARRRRLRHLQEVALRGFEFEANAAQGYILEVASESDESVLVHSEPFNINNPTWVPVLPSRVGQNLSHFVLRAVAVGMTKAFWSASVHLADTDYLCDKLESLAGAPPVGVPLLRIGEQWHVPVGDVSWNAEANNGGSSSSTLPPRLRNATPKLLQASQILGAGHRISEMLDEIQSAQDDMREMHKEIQNLMSHSMRLQSLRQAQLKREFQVHTLRAAISRRLESISRLKDRMEILSRRRKSEEEACAASTLALRAATEEATTERSEIPIVYGTLRMLWLQLKCRRMKMLYDAFQVYPIDVRPDGVQYPTIRGLAVAGHQTLRLMDAREEKNVSTALGMVAHLLCVLANFLEVPLRISVHNPGCSRSAVVDVHHQTLGPDNRPEMWPLFYTDSHRVEKSRFEEALRLLQCGLWQILYSRGYSDELPSQSGNMLELAQLIFSKEIYGDM